jgi:hypothetical protein
MTLLSSLIQPNNLVTLSGTQSLSNKTEVDPKISLSGTNGSTGQVLTSRGTGLSPVWSTTPAVGSNTQVQYNNSGSLAGSSNFVFDGTGAALGTAVTTAAQFTVIGNSSLAALKTANAKEVVTVTGSAATGTINFDVTTQAVLYYSVSATANFTLNFRGSSGTSLNTLMSAGESMTVAMLNTNGATAYYASAFQIDGTSVTPKWQNGVAPSTGSASAIDVYVFTIVKTASATYTVLASQTKFA